MIALSKPSNKAIFFNNFSVFEEIFEGNKDLKIELTKASTFNVFFQNLTNIYKLFSKNQLFNSFHGDSRSVLAVGSADC